MAAPIIKQVAAPGRPLGKRVVAEPADPRLEKARGQILTHDLLRWMILTVAFTAALLGMVLLARRLTTTLQPLPPLSLLSLALLLVGLSVALRRSWCRLNDGNPSSIAPQLTSTTVLLLLGISLSLPGTGIMAMLLFWLVLAIGEGGAWWRTIQGSAWLVHHHPSAVHFPRLWKRWSEMDAREVEGELRQQVLRIVLNGRDCLRGQYACEFGEGERQQIIHAVFSPPFPVPPEVEARCSGSNDVTIKVAQAETFGARLELRRRGTPLSRDSVLVELTASAPLPSPEGARSSDR
jgi:hypothetical protein